MRRTFFLCHTGGVAAQAPRLAPESPCDRALSLTPENALADKAIQERLEYSQAEVSIAPVVGLIRSMISNMNWVQGARPARRLFVVVGLAAMVAHFLHSLAMQEKFLTELLDNSDEATSHIKSRRVMVVIDAKRRARAQRLRALMLFAMKL